MNPQIKVSKRYVLHQSAYAYIDKSDKQLLIFYKVTSLFHIFLFIISI